MTMKTTSYIQWYNENEGRAYPVSETASRVSTEGALLPNDIIVDMSLMLELGYTDAYISSVRITSRLVTVGISTASTGLLVGTYIRDAIQPYKAYPLTGVVDNVSGWITFGSHNALTVEDYRFTGPEQSRIETRAIRYVDALPVKGIAKYGTVVKDVLTGVVRLSGGGGVVVSKDPENANGILIELDAASLYNICSPCVNPATAAVCKHPPLRTINGVPADTDGAITVRFE